VLEVLERIEMKSGQPRKEELGGIVVGRVLRARSICHAGSIGREEEGYIVFDA
jgi:hypothetical protein